MRVILIDDERLAIANLRNMLLNYAHIKIIGIFMDAATALEQVSRLRPDVFFLDIHLQDMNGLAASRLFLEACPQAEIVFVTGYTQYAVKAFAHSAADYLVKPVQDARLKLTVDRLYRRLGTVGSALAVTEQSRLQCFGQVLYHRPGESPVRLRWQTEKVKELFLYLLHHRGKMVSKSALLDLLWPGVPERKAKANLQISIHRIRKIWQDVNELGVEIRYVGSGYQLLMEGVTIDVEQWELRAERLVAITEYNAYQYEGLIEQYTDDYLAHKNYPWAALERQRLQSIWLQIAHALVYFYQQQDEHGKAMHLWQRIEQRSLYSG